ncbi:YjbH domain-containing protein (plasmid) [Arthrobacter sp. Z1-9]
MTENQSARRVLTGIANVSYDDGTTFAFEKSFDSVSAFPTATANVSSHDFLMQQVATVTDSSDD